MYFVFIKQSYFKVIKNVRLNNTHSFIIQIKENLNKLHTTIYKKNKQKPLRIKAKSK